MCNFINDILTGESPAQLLLKPRFFDGAAPHQLSSEQDLCRSCSLFEPGSSSLFWSRSGKNKQQVEASQAGIFENFRQKSHEYQPELKRAPFKMSKVRNTQCKSLQKLSSVNFLIHFLLRHHHSNL